MSSTAGEIQREVRDQTWSCGFVQTAVVRSAAAPGDACWVNSWSNIPTHKQKHIHAHSEWEQPVAGPFSWISRSVSHSDRAAYSWKALSCPTPVQLYLSYVYLETQHTYTLNEQICRNSHPIHLNVNLQIYTYSTHSHLTTLTFH